MIFSRFKYLYDKFKDRRVTDSKVITEIEWAIMVRALEVAADMQRVLKEQSELLRRGEELFANFRGEGKQITIEQMEEFGNDCQLLFYKFEGY